ncbi:MAG: DUF5615 family PIN-like protein [Halobacteria archaeon]|nr:DUF5615 family PIN-like protein [Halobacteria archaeon]
MSYRILCDEHVEPQTVNHLENSGHTAEHVGDTVELSATDVELAEYARENGYIILTNDTDFLDDSMFPDTKVLYYSDNTCSAYELAQMVDERASYVPDQDNLQRVTFLN